MNEKQRWLLADLDKWRDAELNKIGRHGPKAFTEPVELRTMRRRLKALERKIERVNESARKPYEKAKAAIYARHLSVRRVILFEKTAVALRAVKALR